jgi:hypothetical protein
MYHEQRVAEITNNLYHMTGGQPHSSRAGFIDEFKFRVCNRVSQGYCCLILT